MATQWARVFVPVVVKLGPSWFRRFLLERLPFKSVQRMKDISDVMHQRSKEIYDGKKAAIQRGDQDVVHAVGEGRDMLSILRESSIVRPIYCTSNVSTSEGELESLRRR